jgi:hypothetical protein
VRNLRVPELLERRQALRLPRPAPGRQELGRVLDSLIEVQVHGTVDLRRDVERLVADQLLRSSQ